MAAALVRPSCTVTNDSSKFITPPVRRDGIQYNQIYYTRLHEMKDVSMKSAQRKWGSDTVFRNLKDLEPGLACVVIGTLFKEMSLRPSTIKQISDNQRLLPYPPKGKLSSSTDKIFLEDYSQRVILSNLSDNTALTTGMIVAVKGVQNVDGNFEVSDYCLPGMPLQNDPLPSLNNDRYVAIVSGLMVGSDWSDQWAIQQLVDYLTGQLGGVHDNDMLSNIVKVIIAGNSIGSVQSNKSSDKVKYSAKNYCAHSIQSVEELDVTLSQLSSSVPVALMPGTYDPANKQLPRQPLHHCMFPKSAKYDNFKSVTNPYSCTIEGHKFIGTCGENIESMSCCTIGMDSLELLELTLMSSHVAPTAPDILCCYPFSNADPFIMDDCPHVYFAGNQPKFQSKLVTGDDGQKVLLVCVPSFNSTHSLALINLRTLACTPLTFATTATRLIENKDTQNNIETENVLMTETISDIDDEDY